MFSKQKANYSNYQSLEADKLNHHSQLAVHKFNTVIAKTKNLERLQKLNVDDHREQVEERFRNASVGQAEHMKERNEFLERE